MRYLVLVAVACQANPPPPKDLPPPPPPPPVADAAIPIDAAPPAPPAITGVELPIDRKPLCAETKLDDCFIMGMTREAQARPTELHDCPVADRFELREVDKYSKRGALVMRRGQTIAIADTLAMSAVWDPDRTVYVSRLKLDRVTCTGGVLDVAIVATDVETPFDSRDKSKDITSTIHIQCRAAPEVPVCVREPNLALGGKKLSAFLAQVKRASEAHDWPGLLALCSAVHKKSQITDMHQPREAYLAEILGVHVVGNSLNDDAVTFADLARIGTITYVDVSMEGNGWFAVLGTVTIKDHPPLRLELHVATENGQFRLSGAVG
jgi:hypothetical protein